MLAVRLFPLEFPLSIAIDTGVEDDGYPRGLTTQELEVSHTTLKAMAVAVNATIQRLKEMTACKGRVYVIFRISRICLDHLSYTDLRIAGIFPYSKQSATRRPPSLIRGQLGFA